MRAARKKRLYLILLMLVGVSVAVVLALNAFNQNLMYFYSPSEVVAGDAPEPRLEGLGIAESRQVPYDGFTCLGGHVFSVFARKSHPTVERHQFRYTDGEDAGEDLCVSVASRIDDMSSGRPEAIA